MANVLFSDEGQEFKTPQYSDQKIDDNDDVLEKWYKACPDIDIDNNLLTKYSGGWQAAYGTIEASSGFHEWRLKITQQSSSMSIGISSDIENINKTDNAAFHYESGYANYAFISFGCIMDQSCKQSTYPLNRDNGIKYKTGDILIINLDLDEGKISFAINDKNLGIAFTNITKGNGIKYRLAVSMHGKNECVELLSYYNCPKKQALPSENILNEQLKELENRFNKINLNKLKERFKRNNLSLQHDALFILEEYKRFLIIKIIGSDYNANIYSPCFCVDQYWHLHVLDTKTYFKDINILLNNQNFDFNKFIHHDIDGDIDKNKRILRYKNTLNDYQIIFKQKANGKYWNEIDDIHKNEYDDDDDDDDDKSNDDINNNNNLKKDNVEIYIKTLNGKTHTIDVDVNKWTICDIKHKLEEKYGIKACQQRLIGGGKELEDQQPFGKIYKKGIQTLHLIMKLRC